MPQPQSPDRKDRKDRNNQSDSINRCTADATVDATADASADTDVIHCCGVDAVLVPLMLVILVMPY